ncbi:MAG TPA: ABC transporter substrate-binding protein, partial [Acidimicrobiia bacterium]|nr:ABC transporter substrate-binding protein [Acidimicrobiia bacterium]
RRVLRSELLAMGEGAADVLDAFGGHRLLSFDRDPVTRGPTVEIAHEALIGEWDRLRRWIDESRDDLRMQRRLAAGAADWLAAGRGVDFLLGGTRLDQVAEWSATTDLSLDGVERNFLEESLAQRDRERAAEEARSRHEERLRLRTRSRTRLLAASGAVLAALAALAAFAFVQRNQADRLAGELDALGEIARLTSVSSLLAESDPELSALLALQSIDASARAGIPATAETEEALHWALQAARVAYPVAEAPIEVRSGPHGLTGIYRLPLDELVEMAKSQLVNRALTAEECQRYDITPCPENGSTWPALAAEPSRSDVSNDGQPLSGTQVSLVGEYPPEGLVDELAMFEEATGIEVSYERPPGPLEAQIQYTGATPIDLGIAPWLFIDDEASSGQLIDLSNYVDRNEAQTAFGSYLVEAASLGSGLYGMPIGSGVKGLVYYPLAPFTEAGYTAPRSWDELIALSRQMVADGRTPWCIGLGSDGADGWPATDWVEALVLRTGGVDFYERWASGDVGFQHPTVRQAVAMFGEVVFGDGFVRDGPGAVNSTDFFDAVDQLGSDPPGCWLNLMGSWMPELVKSESGQDLGFFVLPPIEPGGTAPLIGESIMVRSFRDRPEVRELVRSLLDPGWGTAWSAYGSWAAPHMTAHLGFDDENCRSPNASDQVNSVRVEMCRVNHDAMRAGQWRFDASDAMPPSVGLIRENNRPGAFPQGMLDYIDRGPESLDEVLAEIDAAWPSG